MTIIDWIPPDVSTIDDHKTALRRRLRAAIIVASATAAVLVLGIIKNFGGLADWYVMAVLLIGLGVAMFADATDRKIDWLDVDRAILRSASADAYVDALLGRYGIFTDDDISHLIWWHKFAGKDDDSEVFTGWMNGNVSAFRAEITGKQFRIWQSTESGYRELHPIDS